GAQEPFFVLWDAEARQRVATLAGHTAADLIVAFSRDGSRLLTAGDYPDNTVRLWQAATGQPTRGLTRHKNRVMNGALSNDGTRAVSSSMDQTAWLWDGVTGRPVAALRGHTGPLRKALFSPDDKHVVSVASDQTLRLWDASSGELLSVLRGHTARVVDAVFTA